MCELVLVHMCVCVLVCVLFMLKQLKLNILILLLWNQGNNWYCSDYVKKKFSVGMHSDIFTHWFGSYLV